MRFVLTEIKDGKARLKTRVSRKDFWVDQEDLVFVQSKHNFEKAEKISEGTCLFNQKTLSLKYING